MIKEGIETIKSWINQYKRVLIMGIVAIITLCIGCFFIYQSQLKKVYEQAVSYYEDNDLLGFESIRYNLSTKYGEAFDEFLLQEANHVLEAYQQEQLSYHEAVGSVERIEAFANGPAMIQEVQEKIDELKQSRQRFEEAEAFAINKQWKEAYECYQQVSKLDPNYEKAIELAQTAKRWWIQDLLVEAVTYYEQEAYEESLTVIEKGLELSPDDEQFLQLQADVHLAMEKGTKENKWSEVKDKITSSIQSGFDTLQNIFDKIFKR